MYAGTQQNVRKLNHRYFMQRVMAKDDFKLKLKNIQNPFVFSNKAVILHAVNERQTPL